MEHILSLHDRLSEFQSHPWSWSSIPLLCLCPPFLPLPSFLEESSEKWLFTWSVFTWRNWTELKKNTENLMQRSGATREVSFQFCLEAVLQLTVAITCKDSLQQGQFLNRNTASVFWVTTLGFPDSSDVEKVENRLSLCCSGRKICCHVKLAANTVTPAGSPIKIFERQLYNTSSFCKQRKLLEDLLCCPGACGWHLPCPVTLGAERVGWSQWPLNIRSFWQI